MNRRIIAILLVFLAVIGILAGCTADAGEDGAFPLPEETHRIEGSVIYNGMDIFEGVEFGMSLEEYTDLVNEKFGEGSTEFTKSLAYNIDGSIDEGIEWTAARTFLYNEELDMNMVLSASFINDVFNWRSVYALGYCEDYDDFIARAELLEDSAEVRTSEFKTKNFSDITSSSGSPILEMWWNNEYFDYLKNTYVWEGPHEEFEMRFLYLPEYIDSEDHKNTGYLKYDTFSYDTDKVMFAEIRMGTYYDAETYDFPGDPRFEYERDIPMFFSRDSN